MNPESTDFTVILSREEILAILTVLNVSTISNLGEEPIPKLTPEQRAYGLIVAERALRARGLAAIDSEGQLRFPTQLLTTMGACVLATNSFFITQTEYPTQGVSQFIVYQSQQGWTLHRPIDGTIHQFSWTEKVETITNQIQTFCRFPQNAEQQPTEPDISTISLSITDSALRQSSQSAREENIQTAVDLLTSKTISTQDSTAFATFLSSPHRVTVIQSVRPDLNAQADSPTEQSDSVAVQSYTFLHTESQLLTVIESDSEHSVGEPTYQVGAAMPADMARLLEKIVSN